MKQERLAYWLETTTLHTTNKLNNDQREGKNISIDTNHRLTPSAMQKAQLTRGALRY